MKTWNGILATALAGAVLFTSCKKQDLGINNTLAATPATQASADRPAIPAIGALLDYRVATVNSQQGAMLYWDAGSIRTIVMSLDATQDLGNPLRLVNFEKMIAVTDHQLYYPIDLGNLNIPFGKYLAYKFGIKLLGDGRVNALNLNGVYNRPTTSQLPTDQAKSSRVPNTTAIHLVIDEPIEFRGEYMPSLLINRQDYYTMTLYFDPATITTGITAQMLDDAQRTNGEIVISSTTNGQLYKIIINNLAKAMRIQFEAKDTLPSA